MHAARELVFPSLYLTIGVKPSPMLCLLRLPWDPSISVENSMEFGMLPGLAALRNGGQEEELKGLPKPWRGEEQKLGFL